MAIRFFFAVERWRFMSIDLSAAVVRRYGLALLCVILATGLRIVFDTTLHDRLPFATYFVAVLVAVWYGGLGPGLVAMLGSYLGGVYLFLEPRGDFDVQGVSSFAESVVFFLAALVSILVIDRLQKANRRAEREAIEAQQNKERLRDMLANIRSSEARKSAILNTALDAIISMDDRGRIVEFNPAAEALFGHAAQAVIGCELGAVLVPPGLREQHRAGLSRLLQTGQSRILNQRVEMPALCSDGREIPIELTVTQITVDDRTLFTAYLRDITFRRQTENRLREEARIIETLYQQTQEKEQRFRELADAMPQIVWSASGDGRLDYYNHRWYEFTGLPEEKLGREDWQSIVHPDDQQMCLHKWCQAVHSGQPYEAEYRFKDHRTQTYRWHLGRALPVRDATGQVVRWFGTSTDIDDQKRSADALRDADRRKDEFLAMLAHELRNPLAPIRNALYLLNETSLDAETLHEARDTLERQVEHLIRLVDDLLDVSRVMQGKIELRTQPIELQTIVQRAVETARPAFESQQQRLDVSLPEQPIWLDGDLIRLSQVVANLLNNAAKYTERGGNIRLTARCNDGFLELLLKDSGIGIDARMLTRIFDLFTQAESSIERSQGGLGIGLTLVKNLVELHGGTVTASSDGLGRGSEFIVRLPMLAAPPAPQSPAAVPETVRPMRVLVVDDHVGSAKILAKLLSRFWHHEVCLAHDGRSAVEVAEAFHPEVILLDIGLPEMNGYEVARQLRSREQFNHTLIVALTGYGQEADRRLAQQAGIDEHLVKPASLDALKKVFNHPKLRQQPVSSS